MNEREQFEADAEPYGFNLTRSKHKIPAVEPWSEYEDINTGHRWGGFMAGAESKQAELNALIAELAKHQSSEFHPDWSMLQASQESLREHMQMVKYKQAELDKANARIAQLKQFIAENVYPDEKYDQIITNSPDTWLLDHDKAVEVRVLEEIFARSVRDGCKYATGDDVFAMASNMLESRK